MVTELQNALLGVSAYKHILALPAVRSFQGLLAALEARDWQGALEQYTETFYQLCCKDCAALGDYIYEHLRYDKGPYPEQAAEGRTTPVIVAAAQRDIRAFAAAAAVSCGELKDALRGILPESRLALADSLPEWEARPGAFDFDSLTAFYVTNGAGLFSRYRAFLWEHGALHPVEQPDFTPMDQLWGYRRQRDQVIANTRALLAGARVNNVLLYGESGTGKSATVKALLGVSEFEKLRLIEVHKEDLAGMADLIRMLGHRPQKFILFIDDLAFDKDDQTYSVLKTILEGGLEHQPNNVAVYATSNRRHLVRETFSDRAGDEVDANETIQEKTSLSERFGLRIPYLALNQREFMELVHKLAEAAGVDMPPAELEAKANQWELRHANRTPRVAQQFISSLRL